MIIGREQERQTLVSPTDKEEAQFCVVYGRRRVDKTYLVRETFNFQFTFQHTGMARTAKREQLIAFRDSLRTYGLAGCKTSKNMDRSF